MRAAVLTLGTKSEEGAMCSCARISQRCRAESGRVEGVILLARACRPPVGVGVWDSYWGFGRCTSHTVRLSGRVREVAQEREDTFHMV